MEIKLEKDVISEGDLKALRDTMAGLQIGNTWKIDDPAATIETFQAIEALISEAMKRETQDDNEISLRKKLNELEGKWRDSLAENGQLKSRIGDQKLDQMIAHFNMDGFYPYYTQQKVKLLFVGREACWMKGKNYVDEIGACLRANDINGYSVNQYPFHKRQFYIAYGILFAAQNEGRWPDWHDVPWASEMATSIFARPLAQGRTCGGLNNLSWAFMNLSKISNDTGNWQTDQSTYGPFIADEGNRDLIREEIRLIGPQLIIGSNVPEMSNILYGDGCSERVGDHCDYYQAANGFPPMINCWHFSAIKKDRECFYDAVGKVFSEKGLMKLFCSESATI